MTLAVILFVSFFCRSVLLPVTQPRQSAEQAAPTGKPAGAPAQDSAVPAQTSPASTQPTSATGAKSTTVPKSTATHPVRKKRRIASNCVPASATTAAPVAGGAPAPSATPVDPPPDASKGAAPVPQPVSTATVCPPHKVVVRQGGTSEPSIQLAGGAVGDQAAQQRHTANEMLGATETNLKKIAGTQLTANQQDMVNQIHQFMDQSKSAVSAGDLERARTLAWKAQLLSEELVSPQK